MAEKKNVRIRLFKDNSRYKGDLFVSVNGVNYKIRRGVEVEVPPEVAEVLEHSQMQDELPPSAWRGRERRPRKPETDKKPRLGSLPGRGLYKKESEHMTVGQALERAEELRPGSRIALATRQAWLKEADAMLRERFFKNSITDAYDDVGADLAWDDSLQDDDVLLAPAPFDALYPHYLCAMTDAALGETDRYVGEQAQYNSLLADLAAWLRRSYPTDGCPVALVRR